MHINCLTLEKEYAGDAVMRIGEVELSRDKNILSQDYERGEIHEISCMNSKIDFLEY
jgi:hypothetical protein